MKLGLRRREDKKDDVAEALYSLADELFELQGVFNLLRRATISFVQTYYGKTINRQVVTESLSRVRSPEVGSN